MDIHITPSNPNTIPFGNSFFFLNKKYTISKFLMKQLEDTIRLLYRAAKACSIIKKIKDIVAIAINFFFLNRYEIPITIKPIKPAI
jgi:hypothetical protein